MKPSLGLTEKMKIFVFGSNTQGRHGKGAALSAKKKYGAIQGKAEGLQGNSYAIITTELRKNKKKVTLKNIAEGVKRFLKFAKEHPEMEFNVTAIGCGLAGRTPKQIGPMFRGHKDNVKLPKEFRKYTRSLEDRFLRAWKKKFPKLEVPVREYRFHETRKFRIDFAWPEFRVGVEIQGGSFVKGGHNRAIVQSSDYEKVREAAKMGWIILPFNTKDIGVVDDGKIYKVVDEVAKILKSRIEESFGNWMAGFTDGEGCFMLYINPRKGRTSFGVNAMFQIGLRMDDRPVLEMIKDNIKCGLIYPKPTEKYYHIRKDGKLRQDVKFVVRKIPDLIEVIIPMFERFKLKAKKRKEFDIWKKGLFLLREFQTSGGFSFTEDLLNKLREISHKLKSLRPLQSDD